MNNKKINFIFYTILLPLIISFIIYFGYSSRYNNYFFTDQMPEYYFDNIYKYRFLSRDIIVYIQKFFDQNLFSKFNYLNKILIRLNTTNFYLTIFAYNTFFYIVTCIVIYKTIFYVNIDNIRNMLLMIIIESLIGFSQFVVTPYDMSSLFLLSLTFLLSIKLSENYSKLNYLLLIFVILISTLNRETSALSISFYAALILNNCSINNLIGSINKLLIPTLAFLIPYIILRIYFNSKGYSNSLIMDNYMINNLFEFRNLLGIIFYIIFTYLSLNICKNIYQKSLIKKYITFSTPYIFIIFFGGILWEVRLFIPLIIGQIILSNIEKLKILSSYKKA